MKATPKSCGCQHCRRARGLTRTQEERAFRHRQNAATRALSEDVIPAGSRPRNG